MAEVSRRSIVYDILFDLKKGKKSIKQAEGDIKKLDKGVKKVEKSAQGAGATFKKLGAAIGAAFAVRAVLNFAKESVKAFDIQEKAVSKLNAILESTSFAANLTSKELQDMAKELQNTTLFTNQATINSQALLLTFKEIGREAFPEAIKVIQDMSTVMNTDLKIATIQLGKALNDPIIGVGALAEVGVSFTAQQKEQIKVLTKTGNLYAAQTIILKELKSEFGGASEAAAKAGTGGFTQLENQITDIKESIGGLIVEALVPLIPSLQKVIGVIGEFLKGDTKISELSKLTEEYNIELDSEREHLDNVFDALRDSNISESLRKSLINDLNTNYKEYLPNLLTEESSLKDVNVAQQALNGSMRERIALQLIQQKITTLTESQIKRREKAIELLRNEFGLTEDQIKELTKLDIGISKVAESTDELRLATDEEVAANQKNISFISKLKDTFLDLDGELISGAELLGIVTQGTIDLDFEILKITRHLEGLSTQQVINNEIRKETINLTLDFIEVLRDELTERENIIKIVDEDEKRRKKERDEAEAREGRVVRLAKVEETAGEALLRQGEDRIELQQELITSTGQLGQAFGNLSQLAADNSQAQVALSIIAVLAAQAEALAKVIASAAGIGFPQNLVAIASSVAIITGLFAQVKGIMAQAQSASVSNVGASAAAFAEGEVDIQRPGQKRGKDSIHAMLMPGESIMTTEQTSQHKPILEAIRTGTLDELIHKDFVQPSLAMQAMHHAVEDSTELDYTGNFKKQLGATELGLMGTKKMVRLLSNIERNTSKIPSKYV